MRAIIWQCKICGDIIISFSRECHYMNTCECGVTSVDLEQEYMRVIGCPDKIKEFDDDEYPFGLELFYDCLFQKFTDYKDKVIDKIRDELYKEIYLNE